MMTKKKAPAPSPMAVEYVDPATLVPAPYNPRRMTPTARLALKRGIQEFGMVDPLIVRREDRLVLGGHQRLGVLKDLGWESVPVVFVDGLDDHRAMALNVLLNNPAAGGEWDTVGLRNLLSDIDANGLDATLTGFDAAALAAHLTVDDLLPLTQGSASLTDPATDKRRKLSWPGTSVPMTDAELETLDERFAAYRDKVGSVYGFVADLLGAHLTPEH